MTADDWRELAVSEFAEVVGGTTPSTADPSNFGGDIPWITPRDLSDHQGRYISRGERNITKKGADSAGLRILPSGSVLLTTRAPIGYVAIAQGPVTTNQGFRSLIVKRGFDPEFVFYLLRRDTERLKAFASGTTFGELSGSTLATLRYRLPPEADQRAIARVLGSLDDKIELNRRINQTLEEICRALFKFWFVDFGPVRAKADGRWKRGESLHGMPANMWDLWPGDFAESEIGQIPTGWKALPLDRIANFRNGLALQRFPPSDDSWLPVLKIAQLRAGRTEPDGERASQRIPKECIVDDGDVIFSWSGSLEVRIWCGGRAALNQHLFLVSSEVFPRWFYYFWVWQHLPEFREIASDKATTMGHIQRYHLTDALVAVPPSAIVEKGTQVIEPLLRAAVQASVESRSLASTRDALLPKLLSGEIRVPHDGGH